MRRVRNGFLAATLLLAFTATAGAEAGRYKLGASEPSAENGRYNPEAGKPSAETGRYNLEASESSAENGHYNPEIGGDDREVTWMRNGCETFLDQESEESAGDQPIDYWAPVCHGYALAAKDFGLFINALIQRQEGLPFEACFEPEAVKGRDVARAFVDHVDRHPESRDKAVAVVMFDAVMDQWCPSLGH